MTIGCTILRQAQQDTSSKACHPEVLEGFDDKPSLAETTRFISVH